MTRLPAIGILLLAAAAARAAPFTDPMRPPSAAGIEAPGPTAVDGPRLESVLIAPDRRVAVINGQQVSVGGKVGSGEVVRITESEVVIRGVGGDATLKLVPEYMKRPASLPEKRTSR